jgi:type II secretory pathway predicted ATPase ExeA
MTMVILPEVLTFFGLHREFRNAGYFEAEQAQRIALALKPAIEAGHLIALTGITGCGKTTTARRIRQDLDKERKILVATNLAVDKERVKLGTLMEAIFADISADKEATLPTQAELRERRLRDLIQRRGRPVALFIDEAHDLHPKTLVGLKRLVEVVQEGGAVLAIVLVGLPRLRVNLRRPAMEEIGARVTMLTLESLQGSGLPFLTWLLERCKRSEVAITDIFTEEAMTMLVDRLTTPLQFIHYAWRALEEAYVAGQKPVDAETVHEVVVPDLDGLEPRLTRLGYPVKSLCEALNARPAEIRAFLRGRLAPGRMQELHQELLKLGVVA